MKTKLALTLAGIMGIGIWIAQRAMASYPPGIPSSIIGGTDQSGVSHNYGIEPDSGAVLVFSVGGAALSSGSSSGGSSSGGVTQVYILGGDGGLILWDAGVNIENWPAVQAVSGTVGTTVIGDGGTIPVVGVGGVIGASESGAWAVSVSNLPVSQPVTIQGDGGTLPVVIVGGGAGGGPVTIQGDGGTLPVVVVGSQTFSTIQEEAVCCNTTATAFPTALAGRTSVTVQEPNGAVGSVWVGGSSVATTTDIELVQGDSETLTANAAFGLNCIALVLQVSPLCLRVTEYK